MSPALVGRAEELALLAFAVSAAPAVAVVEGEAGIGKTRLVSELRAHPAVGDRRFVAGWCRPIREPFPLGVVLDAVRELGDQLTGVTLSPVVGALRPLLPEIAELLPEQPPPLDDRVAERHRVFRGLVGLLAGLGPTVVALEDLHWADEQTLDFLRYLLNDPPPTLSLVLTYRGEEVEAGVRTLTTKLPPSVTKAEVELAPLDVEQTGALAAAIVGADRVSPVFAGYLRARTSGLPFAIEEVLALLRDRGLVERRGEQWARRTLAELEVPRAIRDHVLERASRLPDDVRPVIEAAAVLARSMPDRLIAAVSGQSLATVATALSQAVDCGLLVEDGDAVWFRHVLAAQAIYDGIPGPRRRELHDRAAAQVSRLGAADIGQVAHHLRQAGRLDEWAGAAEKAADQAIEFGHDDEAVRLLDDVLRRAPLDSESRGRLSVKLARAAIDAARGYDVLDLLFEALERDLSPETRGELRLRVAVLVHHTGGDLALMCRLLAAAVEELDDRPDLKAWAMLGLGLPRTEGVPLAEQMTWLRRSLDTLREVDDPVFEAFVRGKVAMMLVSIGDPEWRQLADRIIERTGGSPRHPREVDAYGSLALGASYTGHHKTAHRLLTAAQEGAALLENPQQELVLRSARVVLDYCSGSWDGLDEQLGPLLNELDEQPRHRIDVEVVAACLALARGGLDAAQHRLAALVEQLHAIGGVELLPLPAAALVRVAVARGDVEGAVACADRLMASLALNERWIPATRAIPGLVQAYVAADQLPEASALAARFAHDFDQLDAPLAKPALRHAQGFVHAATRQWHLAADHFLAAADSYDALPCPYDSAQAREHAAASLFAAGDVKAAEPLLAALATFRRLGASWDFDRAASSGRRHGVPVPVRRRDGQRGYGNHLSPRERDVAERAATGRSNKEIARELYLSPETVKKHLQQAMRKLDVHSRAALAHRLTH